MKKQRLKMGEEAWAAYQRQRNNKKANAWKSRNAELVVDAKRNKKQKLIDYKGGKCQMCGYNKDCPNAYDFHHRNPKTKSFSISVSSKKFDKLKTEADKCDLVCKTRHAEVHHADYIKQKEKSKEIKKRIPRKLWNLEGMQKES